jgi:hypothetical protein
MSRNSKRIRSIVRLAVLAFLIVATIDIISIGSTAFLASVQRGMTFTPLSDLMETQVVNPPRPYSPTIPICQHGCIEGCRS